MANFVILNEVAHPQHPVGGYRLCFQRVRLEFGTTQPPEIGYRFMWRDGQGRQSSRPCRVDSIHDMLTLLRLAIEAGWENYDGQIMGVARKPITVSIDDLTTCIDGGDGPTENRSPRWVSINGSPPINLNDKK